MELRDLCTDPHRVLSVGLLVKESDEAIALSCAAGINGDNDVCMALVIPKLMIKSRHVLVSGKDVEQWVNRESSNG